MKLKVMKPLDKRRDPIKARILVLFWIWPEWWCFRMLHQNITYQPIYIIINNNLGAGSMDSGENYSENQVKILEFPDGVSG